MGALHLGSQSSQEADSSCFTQHSTELAKPTAYKTEFEINDFHQSARRKITHKETLRDITDVTGVVIIVRGKYFKPNEVVPEGEKKLHLLLEGLKEDAIRHTKQIIRKIIEEQTDKALRKDDTIGKTAIV